MKIQKKTWVCRCLGASVIWVLSAAQLSAQPADLGSATRPPVEPDRLPDADLSEPPKPQFELPPLRPPREDRVGGTAALILQGVEIAGNNAIGDDELLAAAQPYLARPVTIEELFQLRDALTLIYVNRGYINSGAILPDQEVQNGVVRFDIVEGGLEDIEIEGASSFDPDYIAARLAPGAVTPLNVNDLQERLQLIILDPSVKRLDARLGPGSSPGQARLEVDLEENKPVAFDLTASNNQSTSVGANHLGLGATVRNVLGRSDQFRLSAGVTEGLREAAAEYALPILPNRLTGYLRASISRSDLITPDVNVLDIESETESYTVGLIAPLIETTSDRVELDLSFVRENNRTTLLGDRFSFSPGAVEGETDLSLVRFAQRWQSRGRDRAFSLGSTFTLGLDIFDATDNDGNEPDGEFLAWLGQAEFAQRLLSERDQLVLRGELQLTEDPLLASEQFAAGGLDSVRGYRVNEIVRDNGWTASIEYRLPLLDLLGQERPLSDDMRLELVPFFDAGGGFKHSGRADTARADTLFAPGIGLRYALPDWLSAELYWGVPLTSQDGSTHDALQEHGISFRLRLAY